ncbi:MAG TPA: cytochrome d ubiquinol oxidase subunit II [Gaiellaceae bacterium]
MHLHDFPLIFALIGLAFYTVLGGADFGAGFWQLTAGKGPHAASIRDHAHHAMAPVWEANHVWLVFLLTVVWTAYPTAFGSIASTLSIPLFIAALGIILRGATYALRAGTSAPGELRLIDTVFSLSSILTPFALGTAVGGIASRRVPVGNAAGDEFSSWLNPTSLLIGVLAVATAAYMAAIFLCGDAARLGERDLEAQFRKRALGAGVIAGAIALAGVAVLRSDAHPLYHRLVDGRGLAGLAVSIVAGLVTLALVWRRRYEPARYSAALAVAAIVAGWALAQAPVFLRGLTIEQAAASHDTLVAIIVAVVAGAAILFPSLALLFSLVLRGTLDPAQTTSPPAPAGRMLLSASTPGLLARLAGACLLAGIGLTTIANAGWAHAIGIASLLAFIAIGFPAALPPDILRSRQSERSTKR